MQHPRQLLLRHGQEDRAHEGDQWFAARDTSCDLGCVLGHGSKAVKPRCLVCNKPIKGGKTAEFLYCAADTGTAVYVHKRCLDEYNGVPKE